MTDSMSPGGADQMLGFLRVRAPAPDGEPDQEAIAAFAKAKPGADAPGCVRGGQALPGSYAGIVCWGVHTFTGTNASGRQVPFKFKVVPETGEIVLSDEEAKSKPAQFLVAGRRMIASACVRVRSHDRGVGVAVDAGEIDDSPALRSP